jgi:hypothetical protein
VLVHVADKEELPELARWLENKGFYVDQLAANVCSALQQRSLVQCEHREGGQRCAFVVGVAL